MDMQSYINGLIDYGNAERSRYHLTLGQLKAALEKAHDDLPVMVDVGEVSPGEEDSYRGYYSDLAFSPSTTGKTVGEFRGQVSHAIGSTYEGYKGGDYVMTPDTPLWISGYGDCSGLAVVDCKITLDAFILITRQLD